MNKIEILGRMVQNIEMKESKQDKTKKYGVFTLAVPRKTDKEKTDFIQCVAFGKLAETIEKYTEKGNRIIVEGSLQIDKYDDKDGNKKISVSIIVNDFYFVDFKVTKKEGETTEELPF